MDVAPRPTSAFVESRAVVGDVVVRPDADAQAPAPIRSRPSNARMLGMFLREMTMGRHKIAQLPFECRELGDAIGADSVDPDAFERLPLLCVIGRPGNDATID